MSKPSGYQLHRVITAWMLRVGIARATLALTALTVVLAVIGHGSILAVVTGPNVPLENWIIAAILVPILITPVVSWMVMSMAFDLSNAQAILSVAALTDQLTQVSNRHFFVAQAELELEQHRRLGAPLSVLMLDIDKFKVVNDTYGHGVGDLVLVKTAALCRETLRGGDLFARYGGEEFAVLLPLASANDAAVVAEKLRRAVSEMDLSALGLKAGITISIGVAAQFGDYSSLQLMLDQADRQLYVAKKAGRNRVGVSLPRRRAPPRPAVVAC